MRGAMQYFACQMPKFLVEIQISMRRDVARGIYTQWNRGIYTRRGHAH